MFVFTPAWMAVIVMLGLALGSSLTLLAQRLRRRHLELTTYDEYADVRRFHERFGFLVFDAPGHLTTRKALERFRFMAEELGEFETAVVKQDLEGQADALIDLVYVAKGTALMLGLPWEDLWEEVQRANMDKVRGQTHRGNASDVCKPKGWLPPQHEIILAAAGYDKEAWFAPKPPGPSVFVESAGRDDHLEATMVQAS